jgi:hypothetical protein
VQGSPLISFENHRDLLWAATSESSLLLINWSFWPLIGNLRVWDMLGVVCASSQVAGSRLCFSQSVSFQVHPFTVLQYFVCYIPSTSEEFHITGQLQISSVCWHLDGSEPKKDQLRFDSADAGLMVLFQVVRRIREIREFAITVVFSNQKLLGCISVRGIPLE